MADVKDAKRYKYAIDTAYCESLVPGQTQHSQHMAGAQALDGLTDNDTAAADIYKTNKAQCCQ
jgi:hypothetical protein